MDWLSRNKTLNFALVMLYFFAVVLPHELVGKQINSFFSDYSRSTYNLIITVLVFILAVILCLYLLPRIKSHSEKAKLSMYFLVSALLVILCFNIIFVVNVEAIHFIQYGILAVLLFPMSRSAAVTMSFAVLAGALDELYQYLILDNTNFYYDFNDVLLDTIGAGMGLLMLKSLKMETKQSTGPWYKSIGLMLTASVAVTLLVAGMLGQFSVNPLEDPAYFTLFKKAPEGFWHVPPGPYARFHILRPIPGLLVIYAIAYFYSLLDRLEPTS